MSITVLLYKDTPFEDVTPEQINEYLALVDFCVEKELSGNMKHTTFQLEGIVPFGYLLDLDDEVHHTDDLYLVYLGVAGADNPKLESLVYDIGIMTHSRPIDAYAAEGNTVVKYGGAAKVIRMLHAHHRRGNIAAV